LDPALARAKSLIETFEVKGVARQKIPHLLHAELKLPNATYSTPDKLEDKVKPEVLDWVANHLAISCSWLDTARLLDEGLLRWSSVASP